MQPRITELLAHLKSSRAVLMSALDTVPAEKRSVRPSDGKWSVAENIEHLAMMQHSMARLVSNSATAGRASGLRAETDTASVLGGPFSEQILNRDTKRDAPERVRPTGSMSPEDALADLERATTELHAALADADGLALGDITQPHPIFGDVNIYQWIAASGSHEIRHAAQIREIAQALA